jgi:hypothetical protein
METGIPFNATDFVDVLQTIYTKTHPPDEVVIKQLYFFMERERNCRCAIAINERADKE